MRPLSKLLRTLRIHDHTFVPALIGPGETVLDVGANEGGFARWLLANTPARIHALEPNPRLFPLLPKDPRLTNHPYALADKEGILTFNLSEHSQESSLRFGEGEGQPTPVGATTLEAFFREQNVSEVSLLKMDIEGAEVPVLSGAPEELLLRIKQITVEFHDFLHPEDRPAIESVLARMRGMGFAVFSIAQFSYRDVLFVNTRRVKVTALARFKIFLFSKYLAGLGRVLRGRWGLPHHLWRGKRAAAP